MVSDGNPVAVGTGEKSTTTGAAYVFERNQGGAENWGDSRELSASNAQVVADVGASVGISGDTSVVGARGNTAGGSGGACVDESNQGVEGVGGEG